jgi:predicted transcriptional regulator
MEGSVVLISVHPEYAEKIVCGEKRLEFRRRWAVRQVSFLVIYATAPVKKIVAVSQIKEVYHGSKSYLWELARKKSGGITRRKLFEYMEGKQDGVALELSKLVKFSEGASPYLLFGKGFRPPQSFRYLSHVELAELKRQLEGKKWESYS